MHSLFFNFLNDSKHRPLSCQGVKRIFKYTFSGGFLLLILSPANTYTPETYVNDSPLGVECRSMQSFVIRWSSRYIWWWMNHRWPVPQFSPWCRTYFEDEREKERERERERERISLSKSNRIFRLHALCIFVVVSWFSWLMPSLHRS